MDTLDWSRRAKTERETMAKRKALEDVPSLQSSLALEAALNTEDGLKAAIKILSDLDNESIREGIKKLGYVVAPKKSVEQAMRDVNSLGE